MIPFVSMLLAVQDLFVTSAGLSKFRDLRVTLRTIRVISGPFNILVSSDIGGAASG